MTCMAKNLTGGRLIFVALEFKLVYFNLMGPVWFHKQ